MINNLLCAAGKEPTLTDKLIEACVVVLIGVVTVFVLLYLLILVVKLLKYVEVGLVKWDAIMGVYRANKAEVKKVKKSYLDIRDEKINAIYNKLAKGEMTKAEGKAAIAEIKSDFNTNQKPLMTSEIAALKESQKKAKQKGVETETQVAEVVEEVVDDERLIAVITAAIAVATEQECAERKVKFKVRTIKHIK